MGNREDGADSLASQVKPASHWPGMRVLIAVVSGENTKKYLRENLFWMQLHIMASFLL